MEICKNCNYFDRNSGNWNKNIKYGKCTNSKITYDRMESDGYQETDYLIYTDYEGYNATCEVGEEFGCVHFKERKKGDIDK